MILFISNIFFIKFLLRSLGTVSGEKFEIYEYNKFRKHLTEKLETFILEFSDLEQGKLKIHVVDAKNKNTITFKKHNT